jgi:hypothetical protein
MARNPIQFDKGLSLTEFRKNYGTEEQCRRAVVALRWPSGAEAAMKGASGGGACQTLKRVAQCRPLESEPKRRAC